MAISFSNSSLTRISTNQQCSPSRPHLTSSSYSTTTRTHGLFRHQSCPPSLGLSFPGGALAVESKRSPRKMSITTPRVLLTPKGSPIISVAGNQFREKTTPPLLPPPEEVKKEKDDDDDEYDDDDDVYDDEEWQLADRWRTIHGKSNWETLIKPRMDNLLRSEVIRYGEMAQACYDAFDNVDHSLNYGRCKYTGSEFFAALGMDNHNIHGGYDITRYLYAASKVNLPNILKKSLWSSKVWERDANWIGYVAVSNDETTRRLGRRDITVAWRGTVTKLEWFKDLMDILCPISSHSIPCWDKHVKVESGFLTLYTDVDDDCEDCLESARIQLLTELTRLMELYEDEEISITTTGHSLGSALAVLSAFDIAETGVGDRPEKKRKKDVHVSVFSFSGPRVGNMRFKERLENLGVKVLRVYNVHDVVPTMPGYFLNEDLHPKVLKFTENFPWTYTHVGTEFALDHKKSPSLKKNFNRVHAHNMEALLHLIDGYQGTGIGETFQLATPRDIALVNKASDFLNDDLRIPPNWMEDANKGMVNIQGVWQHYSVLNTTLANSSHQEQS